MVDTSIRLDAETRDRLKDRKVVTSESFDSVIERLLDATEGDAPVALEV